jgi:spermidine synthase
MIGGVNHPLVIERLATARGELVLRHAAREGHYEIISNGVFLMDTRGGSSERLLVGAALDGAGHAARVLLGGLGVGFSLVEALRHPLVQHVTVVELEPAVVAWHATHLASFSHGALDDPRVTVVCADLRDWLRRGSDQFDAICVDIDNGPDWTVTDGNAALYLDGGLIALRRRLAPGGTLTVWSAAASPQFHARLRRQFSDVQVRTVAVPRGEPDHIYVARGEPATAPNWR